MKTLFAGIIIDLILLQVIWLSGTLRIILLLAFACGNMLFYLWQLSAFLLKVRKTGDNKGYLLHFVLLQIFLFLSIFLYKLADLLLVHSAR